MLRYTINRVLLAIPTLLGVAILVFLMLRIVPGDIVEVKLRGDGGAVSQETIEMERQRLGLDKPLVIQFKDWMVGVATLDLGKSMWTERPVMEEISLRLELSLQVAIMATIFAVLIAIPLGTMAALFRDTWIDYLMRIATIGGISIPAFWFGMLIMSGLLAGFNWLPPITFTPIYVDPIANLTQLIWPALAVGYRYCAVTARMIRSSLLEVLNEDYIRTARAKGVYERLVISRHALRNALLPAITAPAGKSQRRCPDRYREPFSPISRLLDGGLRHTYAGREQSRGKGIGRGANSAVARPRRSWPTLGGAVWESGDRREAGVP